MLSAHIIGNYKLVVFIDDIEIERNSIKLMKSLLQDKPVTVLDEKSEIKTKSHVILSPISKLLLKHSECNIFNLIHMLKLNDNVDQIFCWITTKNIKNNFLIPFLDHMSEITVTIKTNHLSILTKRKYGNVKLKKFQHELQAGKMSLKDINDAQQTKEEIKRVEDPEISGTTFKIGQFKNDELEAKKNLKLPFEIMYVIKFIGHYNI